MLSAGKSWTGFTVFSFILESSDWAQPSLWGCWQVVCAQTHLWFSNVPWSCLFCLHLYCCRAAVPRGTDSWVFFFCFFITLDSFSFLYKTGLQRGLDQGQFFFLPLSVILFSTQSQTAGHRQASAGLPAFSCCRVVSWPNRWHQGLKCCRNWVPAPPETGCPCFPL